MTIALQDLLLYPLILLCAWIIARIVADTRHRRYALFFAFPAALAIVQAIRWIDLPGLSAAVPMTGTRPLDSLIYVGLPVIVTFAAFFRFRNTVATDHPSSKDLT